MDFDTYRKWIEYQMSPEMNLLNIEIDHVKPVWIYEVSRDEELRETFCLKNTQPHKT